uniref:MFS domain-containing protein n=1 Tax=Meloidogyne floridensis TaxID=298350 RepID=A0A915NXB9_9BILA
MVISTLCLSSILSNILTFNFTYICMAGVRPDNFSQINISSTNYDEDLDYSSAERTALFMAVAVGALLAVFPLTILLGKFGSRIVFGCLGYMSALSTLLIPIAAVNGFPYILSMRIIAPLFTMPLAGELCTSSVGWPAVYYLHGLVSILLFTLFMLYHRNYPQDHPMVSRTELVKVMFNKGGSIYSGPGKQHEKSPKVPYKAMYSDMAIWAILVASFGNFMGTQLSLQFMPTYINKAN